MTNPDSALSSQDLSSSYDRTVLFTSKDFEIVRCRWNKGATSPLHDHAVSSCAFLVEEGEFENRTELGFKSERVFLECGASHTTPIGASHQLRCLSETGQTIHVYVPLQPSEPTETLFRPLRKAALREQLDITLSEEGIPWEALETLLKGVERLSISTASPYFMNQLFSGVIPETIAATALASRTRTTLVTSVGSPVFTEIEKELIERLGELIGWTAGTRSGIALPGGSLTNFMAIHCARHRAAPHCKKTGITRERFTVYVSRDAHYSVRKGVNVLGLGQDSLREIAVDTEGRMYSSEVADQITRDRAAGFTPLIIIATAGTTVLGAFDPIQELSEIATQENIWLHIDAAWGAPVFFSERGQSLVQGAAHADSVSFDAHKFFASNLALTFFFTRHPDILFEANDVGNGQYVFHEHEPIDQGRLSWQCGRGPDALSLWTLWKSVGQKELGKSFDRLLDLAQEITAWIKKQPRLRLIATPSFLNVCVEVLPPDGVLKDGKVQDGQWSKHARNTLIEQNKCMVNFSIAEDNSTFLRLILVHPSLELHHMTDILTWALEVV